MSFDRIMTRGPSTLTPEAVVLDALRWMSLHKLGAAPVLRNEKLCGIFTYRDLIDRVLLAGQRLETTRLEDVMTVEVVTVRQKDSYGDALRILVDRDFSYAPVTDDEGHVLGMISLRDLLAHQAEDLSNRLDALTRYFSVDGPGGD